MAIHPSIGDVTTVRHTLRRAGTNLGHFNSDLIFVGPVPTIVLEWMVGSEGDIPAVAIPLDPTHLHKIGWKDAEYMYELEVEDPRRFD
jgi:hypothetical protein